MNILAIETSTYFCSVALLTKSQFTIRESNQSKKHSNQVLPMIEDLLSQANMKLNELSGVAFSAGPGSFTGLRVACAVAQGIGFANSIPVVPVSSMEAVAMASKKERVFVCLDARMNQVFCAAYQLTGKSLSIIQAPILVDINNFPSLPGSAWYGYGDGFKRYPDLILDQLGLQICNYSEDTPSLSRYIGELGVKKILSGELFPPEKALPFYVRNKVAKDIYEQVK